MFAGLEADGEASDTPATHQGTGKRKQGTAEMGNNDLRAMEQDRSSLLTALISSLPELRWKAGVEVPPFMSANLALVQGLKDLLDGAVENVPMIDITEAVAVQIFRLIFDKNACAPALKSYGMRGLYIILASLARGTRTEPPDAAAFKKSVPSSRTPILPRPG
jgi:hypothetical protein